MIGVFPHSAAGNDLAALFTMLNRRCDIINPFPFSQRASFELPSPFLAFHPNFYNPWTPGVLSPFIEVDS